MLRILPPILSWLLTFCGCFYYAIYLGPKSNSEQKVYHLDISIQSKSHLAHTTLPSHRRVAFPSEAHVTLLRYKFSSHSSICATATLIASSRSPRSSQEQRLIGQRKCLITVVKPPMIRASLVRSSSRMTRAFFS